MIIRTGDDRAARASDDIRILESLREENEDQRIDANITREIRNIQAGLSGENHVSYFLDNAYRRNPDVVVLHDIRIEDADGRVAQIDHIVITRDRCIYLLETKATRGGIERDEDGNWYRLYGGGQYREKMSCPIEQGRRHAEIVAEVLDGDNCTAEHAVNVLIVRDTTDVKAHRDRHEEFHVVAADRFETWLEARPTVRVPVTSIKGRKQREPLNDDEMLGIAFRFQRAHTPITFDWRGKLGMPRPKAITEGSAADPTTTGDRPKAADPAQTARHEKYVNRFIGQRTIEIPGGTIMIRRHEDDLRTLIATGDEDVRRHVSRLCKKEEGTWIEAAKAWLMTFDQCVAAVEKITGRAIAKTGAEETDRDDDRRDARVMELPSAAGKSILSPSGTQKGLFQFDTPDGPIRVLRLQTENWVFLTFNNEMRDQRVAATCRATGIGRYYAARDSYLVPQHPPELIEQAARAVAAFQHDRSSRADVRSSRRAGSGR